MASHVCVYTPCASERIARFPSYSKTPVLRTGRVCNAVKAVSEKRDSLDHLQRASHYQPQQKKKAAPVSSPGTWERFPSARTVQQMMETMDRIMEDPFAYSGNWPSLPERVRDGYNGYNRGRTPWAIKERENEYKIRFDMPGMTKNDVKVWIEENNMLVIKAEKVPRKRENQVNGNEHPVEEEEWPNSSYGSYNSRIALPQNIEFEKIKAEVKDGVLYLTVPKASTTSKIIGIDVQ
ncbi:hypothetical protein JRO89_XS01G0227700 [Xanthoceras sorbifolium]|uniref:SHSP domain-containing protein n=1 Tax=Xanthoceras sorbifolium TaxID=99658 RepID=A0ABQ8IKM6_9ROSI|nr:hypothetical protein JRO89_XS01G0227700 [Xanthoceras sorbifolium]